LNSCVKDSERAALASNSDFTESTAYRVIYRNVKKSDGLIETPAPMIQSDVFTQLYMAAAVGCMLNEDPQQC